MVTAAVTRLRQEGYILPDELIYEDHERGSKVTRKGYQAIIEAVRAFRVGAVLVYMFDRWGRDGAAWLARAREFERLGVPIISVQEGKDEGGLIRFIRAGVAEEYSRQLAKRVRPAREKSAREGTHMGRTMFGYKRVYPEWDGKGRRPLAHLVPDPATANKPPTSVTLASDLLRCAECGNAMVAHQRRGDPTRKGEYACLTRHRAAGACSGGYRLDVAHAGLLAEVRRLRDAPWTQESVNRLMGTEGASEAERVTTLRRALDDEHEALRRLQRRIIDMDQDPTPEERAAFSQIKTEIVARIRSLESQLHETSERATALPDLRQLHERLTRIELATLVDDFLAQGDDDGLRELVLDVVQSARIVERWPKRRTTWARVEVTWTPRVQELLRSH
jgi:hypothetical protein